MKAKDSVRLELVCKFQSAICSHRDHNTLLYRTRDARVSFRSLSTSLTHLPKVSSEDRSGSVLAALEVLSVVFLGLGGGNGDMVVVMVMYLGWWWWWCTWDGGGLWLVWEWGWWVVNAAWSGVPQGRLLWPRVNYIPSASEWGGGL